MERVAFLVERTGERISCLLNPQDVQTRRIAGVQRRGGAGGGLFGHGVGDDPLIASGGGVTEYDLQLLFDVEVAAEGKSGGPRDVRDFTRPLWALGEAPGDDDGPVGPTLVRLVWGKAWNVLGVVVHVEERLERFDAAGAPGRSWLSLRLRRVPEADAKPAKGAAAGGGGGGASPSPARPPSTASPAPAPPAPPDPSRMRAVTPPVDDAGVPLERFDLIAARRYGDPALALPLAAYNDIDDPLRLDAGTAIVLPPATALPGSAP